MSGPESHVHKYKVATVQRRSEAFRVVCAGTGLLLYIGLQTSVDIERDMLPAANESHHDRCIRSSEARLPFTGGCL